MNESRLTTFAPWMLSVLRIMSGLLFLAHGTQKFLYFPAGETAGFGWTFSHPAAYAGLIELVAARSSRSASSHVLLRSWPRVRWPSPTS